MSSTGRSCRGRSIQSLQIVQKHARPLVDVMVKDLAAHGSHALRLVARHIVHGFHQAIFEAIDVVRINQVLLTQFPRRAGELAEHKRPVVSLAACDVLLGYQVHPVAERRHHHDVSGAVERRHFNPRMRHM